MKLSSVMRNLIQPKKAIILPIILPLFLAVAQSLEGSILFIEDFETDGLGTRYTGTGIFSDGTDDYFTRTDGSTEASGIPGFSNFGGTYFWAGEDMDATENPGALCLLDFSGINLASFPSIQVSLDLGAGSGSAFDSVDDFLLVQYRVDAGPWQTALAFQNNGQVYNGPLLQDTDLDGIGDFGQAGLALQTYTSPALAVAGAFMDIRIDTLMTSGFEEIAFDNLTVTAVPEPSATALILALSALLMIRANAFSRIRGNESQT